ncbi:hypothetical protein DFH28DRAFT_946947 [Melampsora americana]|nr:hypothetical protein DFH28DRAFT_946947 [Melampsora americana]
MPKLTDFVRRVANSDSRPKTAEGRPRTADGRSKTAHARQPPAFVLPEDSSSSIEAPGPQAVQENLLKVSQQTYPNHEVFSHTFATRSMSELGRLDSLPQNAARAPHPVPDTPSTGMTSPPSDIDSQKLGEQNEVLDCVTALPNITKPKSTKSRRRMSLLSSDDENSYKVLEPPSLPGVVNLPHSQSADEVMKYLSKEVFVRLLENSPTREELRVWLMRNEPSGDGTLKLDRWQDEQRTVQLARLVRKQCASLFNLYYQNQSGSNVIELPNAIREGTVQHLVTLSSSLEGPHLVKSQEWLISSLFESEFQRFIASKLVQRVKSQLTAPLSSSEGSQVEFILLNPRLTGCPAMMVSPGFCTLTGYGRKEILGGTSHYFPGPGTLKASIDNIDNAVRNQESCIQLMINYRQDGTAFYSLLEVVPLCDPKGEVTYLLCSHVNVTSDLETFENLSSLILPDVNSTGPTKKADEPDDTQKQSTTENSKRSRFKSITSASIRDVTNRKDWLTGIGRKKPKEDESWSEEASGTSQKLTVTSEDTALAESPSMEHIPENFSSIYPKFLVFKKAKYAVIYATPSTLSFLGLPAETKQELYNSSIIGTSFLHLIKGKNPKNTNTIRTRLIQAVEKALPTSSPCSLSYNQVPINAVGTKAAPSDSPSVKSATVHLIPLLDDGGDAAAYVAILA